MSLRIARASILLQETTLGRLSGGVLGKKRFSRTSEKSPRSRGGGSHRSKSESGGSAHDGGGAQRNRRGWTKMASTSSVGAMSSDGQTPTADSFHSDASHRGSKGSRFGSSRGFSRSSKPPPGPTVVSGARRGSIATVVDPAWGKATVDTAANGGGNKVLTGGLEGSPLRMMGTGASRRHKKKTKDGCEMS